MNLFVLRILASLAIADDTAEVERHGTAGEEITVRHMLTLEEARNAFDVAIEAEGYARVGRDGNFAVFSSGDWKPDVLLHDDGWILVGWGVDGKAKERVKADIYDATRDAVRAINDAVAAGSSRNRLEVQIPAELRDLWEKADLSVFERHALLFDYWDSRTDTPEGDAARAVVEQFFHTVVQASDTPVTAAGLSELNARRHSRRGLELGE